MLKNKSILFTWKIKVKDTSFKSRVNHANTVVEIMEAFKTVDTLNNHTKNKVPNEIDFSTPGLIYNKLPVNKNNLK